MKKIIDALKEKESFVSLNGASKEAISYAEQKLNVQFTSEYIAYVTEFGAAAYYGHELTGVCTAKFLDVVEITTLEKTFNQVPADWYVIEQAHIDGIVIWQAADGKIYQTEPNRKQKKLCDSLLEYIEFD